MTLKLDGSHNSNDSNGQTYRLHVAGKAVLAHHLRFALGNFRRIRLQVGLHVRVGLLAARRCRQRSGVMDLETWT